MFPEDAGIGVLPNPDNLRLAVLRPFHKCLLAPIYRKDLLLNSLRFGEAYTTASKAAAIVDMITDYRAFPLRNAGQKASTAGRSDACQRVSVQYPRSAGISSC